MAMLCHVMPFWFISIGKRWEKYDIDKPLGLVWIFHDIPIFRTIPEDGSTLEISKESRFGHRFFSKGQNESHQTQTQLTTLITSTGLVKHAAMASRWLRLDWHFMFFMHWNQAQALIFVDGIVYRSKVHCWCLLNQSHEALQKRSLAFSF